DCSESLSQWQPISRTKLRGQDWVASSQRCAIPGGYELARASEQNDSNSTLPLRYDAHSCVQQPTGLG
ncbi:hypothetical protein P7K49_029962, partial [Saguinus oedipus]